MSDRESAATRSVESARRTLAPTESDVDPLDDLPVPKQMTRRTAFRAGLAALVAFGGLFIVGYSARPRGHTPIALPASENGAAALRVDLVRPKPGPKDRALTLSGTVEGLEETDISPRTNGYVRRWLVDIGDRVEAGQPLAEIDTPDLDLEIDEARAALGQSEAAIVQARATRDRSAAAAKRYGALAESGVTSADQSEQRQTQATVDEAGVRVSEAAVRGHQATLHRLETLKTFSRVLAPFQGTITKRGIDRGSLVTAGNSQILFRIAAVETVRLFVQVPQAFVPSVRPGLVARVSLHEYPGRAFEGSISRAAQMLDATTRTMNTEVLVPNPEHRLLPGMYAQVTLTLDEPHRVLIVPATAVTTNASGVRVAVVDASSRVHFAPVSIERDNGSEIEIASGLDGAEQLVANPGSHIEEGRLVRP